MKNKITVLSSCHKKDVLGTGEFLQVTVSTLHCLKIFNALISITVSLPTRPSGEQPRNGNSGLTQNPVVDTHVFVAISYVNMAFGSLSRP